MRLTWRHEPFTDGHGEHYAADDEVRIDYCQNARPTPWRVQDSRGVSPATPKPLESVMFFGRTLREAKAWAECNDWHLAGVR